MKRSKWFVFLFLGAFLLFSCRSDYDLSATGEEMEISFGQEGSGAVIDWGAAPQKRLYAKHNYFNKPAPKLLIQEWLTEAPEWKGKFVLLDFWATWCPPCQSIIPRLNRLAEEFKNDLVVIGVSDESSEKVRKMKRPEIKYYSGIDRKSRTLGKLGVDGIPHALLIDPSGIVCWQGLPSLKNDPLDEHIIRDRISRFNEAL